VCAGFSVSITPATRARPASSRRPAPGTRTEKRWAVDANAAAPYAAGSSGPVSPSTLSPTTTPSRSRSGSPLPKPSGVSPRIHSGRSSLGVDASVSAGTEAPFLSPLGWSLLGGGFLLLLVSGGLIVLGVRGDATERTQPAVAA
jgi:hypothetical protein